MRRHRGSARHGEICGSAAVWSSSAAWRGRIVAAQRGRARTPCGEADPRSAHPAVELRSSLSCAAGARARAGKAHPRRRSSRPLADRSRCRPRARHILARFPRRCRGPSELVRRMAASSTMGSGAHFFGAGGARPHHGGSSTLPKSGRVQETHAEQHLGCAPSCTERRRRQEHALLARQQRGGRRGPQRGEARRKRRREVATTGGIQRMTALAGTSRTCVQRREVMAVGAQQLLQGPHAHAACTGRSWRPAASTARGGRGGRRHPAHGWRLVEEGWIEKLLDFTLF